MTRRQLVLHAAWLMELRYGFVQHKYVLTFWTAKHTHTHTHVIPLGNLTVSCLGTLDL